MEDCIVYLVFQLRSSGYFVRFTWPNLLHISWKHHESSYVTQQSPIIQAMAPSMPAAPKLPLPTGGSQKKKSAAGAAAGKPPVTHAAVSFNEAVEILNSVPPPAATHGQFGGGAPAMRSFEASYSGLAGLASGGGGGIQAPARRAADYMPPASFVQQMERPERVPPPRNNVQHKPLSSAQGGSGDVLADLWSM